MKYYFARKEDAPEIFALMSDWWKEIKDETISIDEEYFILMHEAGNLLTLCSRDEEGRLVGCYVGVISPDLFHKGEQRVEPIAACFIKEHRTVRNFKKMLDTLESICQKLGLTGFTASIVQPRMQKYLEKNGYTFDVINMSRRVE